MKTIICSATCLSVLVSTLSFGYTPTPPTSPDEVAPVARRSPVPLQQPPRLSLEARRAGSLLSGAAAGLLFLNPGPIHPIPEAVSAPAPGPAPQPTAAPLHAPQAQATALRAPGLETVPSVEEIRAQFHTVSNERERLTTLLKNALSSDDPAAYEAFVAQGYPDRLRVLNNDYLSLRKILNQAQFRAVSTERERLTTLLQNALSSDDPAAYETFVAQGYPDRLRVLNNDYLSLKNTLNQPTHSSNPAPAPVSVPTPAPTAAPAPASSRSQLPLNSTTGSTDVNIMTLPTANPAGAMAPQPQPPAAPDSFVRTKTVRTGKLDISHDAMRKEAYDALTHYTPEAGTPGARAKELIEEKNYPAAAEIFEDLVCHHQDAIYKQLGAYTYILASVTSRQQNSSLEASQRMNDSLKRAAVLLRQHPDKALHDRIYFGYLHAAMRMARNKIATAKKHTSNPAAGAAAPAPSRVSMPALTSIPSSSRDRTPPAPTFDDMDADLDSDVENITIPATAPRGQVERQVGHRGGHQGEQPASNARPAPKRDPSSSTMESDDRELAYGDSTESDDSRSPTPAPKSRRR